MIVTINDVNLTPKAIMKTEGISSQQPDIQSETPNGLDSVFRLRGETMEVRKMGQHLKVVSPTGELGAGKMITPPLILIANGLA